MNSIRRQPRDFPAACCSFLKWSLLTALILVLSFTALARSIFGINARDFITEQEFSLLRAESSYSLDNLNTTHNKGDRQERIPRIIHQTWQSSTNQPPPDRWLSAKSSCLEMYPDFEFKLWTNENSRDFISRFYPWFLPTFDNYKYVIQRADAVRYFALHHYGGVYLDLDVGCRRRMDPLLHFDVIVPQTAPIGISNDLIFTSPRHPFIEQTIRNLSRFNHNFLTHYATVMFSTGPMFLSAQYKHYTRKHTDIRVLPRSLYGKHVKPGAKDMAIFFHLPGRSWHTGDASYVMLARNALPWIRSMVYLVGIVLVAHLIWRMWRSRLYRNTTAIYLSTSSSEEEEKLLV